MKWKFSKDLVLKSIKQAGNENMITDAILKELDNLDGCEATKSDWDSLVNDKELYIVKGRDGKTTKVEKRFLIMDEIGKGLE